MRNEIKWLGYAVSSAYGFKKRKIERQYNDGKYNDSLHKNLKRIQSCNSDCISERKRLYENLKNELIYIIIIIFIIIIIIIIITSIVIFM